MPILFPTPERCLLVQAANWFIDGTLPLPDEDYLCAPIEIKAENSEFRELFLALRAKDCDVRGDLVVNLKRHKAKLPFDEIGDAPPPEFTLAQDVKILTDKLLFQTVNFKNSSINSKDLRSNFSNVYAKGEIEKISQTYPRHEGWTVIFNFRNVTVDFSKLRTFLLAEDKDMKKSSKLGAPAKYNWDLIWAELVVRADLDGLPKTQAKCIRDISQWCVNQFDEAPSETTLKAKLKHIYGHRRKVGN